MSVEPGGHPRSPDGRWWWDGGAWQPIGSLPAPTVTLDAPPPAPADWPAWLPRSADPEMVARASHAPIAPAPVGPVVIPGEASTSSWVEARFGPAPGDGSRRRRGPLMVGVAGLGVLAIVFAGTVLTHSDWYTSPVAALPLGGYPAPAPTASIPPVSPTAVAPAPAVLAPAPAVPPGWLVYVNRTWKYSIAYPPDWYQPPADPGGQDSFHYFSNENVAKHGVMDRTGIDLAVQARQQCLSVGGVRGAGVEPISFAQISVDGHPVTRYFDEFRPGVASANGWNLKANVPVGGNCIQVGSFTYLRSVSEAMRPIFDQMVASLRPA